MSLPFLLQCRPASTQGAGSKLRSGGARSKASYSGGRSSIDAGASHKHGCKRRLAALPEHQTEHVPWKEVFGIDEDDITAVESLRLKRVGVVGLHNSLATELVDCFAAKPSVVSVGVHLGPDGTCSKFDIMPGVTALHTARDVCSWSDIIFLCGSYEDASTFLRTQGAQNALKGKCVLQLTSGTPEEALTASRMARIAGVRYLDAFVFSEGTANVFNHDLSAMMVSGDKKAWREVEGVVRAAAPASFYGGRRVEWANTIGVGVVSFLASVRMGLSQAQSITARFGLPPHVLTRVLNSGYMHAVQSLVTSAATTPSPYSSLPGTTGTSLQTVSAPAGSAGANTFNDTHGGNSDMLQAAFAAFPSPVQGMHVMTPTATAPAAKAPGGAATPSVGSAAWISQLEQIRELCQKAHVDYSVIDGFLAASEGAAQRQQPHFANTYMPLPAVLAASYTSGTPLDAYCGTLKEEPFGDYFGPVGASKSLDFDVQQTLMDTDMVGDDAGWTPSDVQLAARRMNHSCVQSSFWM